MMIALICFVAFAASLLTFFSGFGLGTLLTPVFAFFFPIEMAIAMTCIVHFLNNVFKFGLTYKNIDKQTLLRFGLFSIIGAAIGALLLSQLSDNQVLTKIFLFNKERDITLVKCCIGVLMLLFALLEIVPFFQKLNFSKTQLWIGGLISGFFGGISGHQGALRTMFLVKSGLDKKSFIATGIAIACLVDITRMSIYAQRIASEGLAAQWMLIGLAVISAFIGAYLGSKMLDKVTIKTVQICVSIGLILMAVALILGLI
jgi:uncharacterized protein